MRREVSSVLLGVVLLGLTACGASTDQSGWEMARKKQPTERPQTFPEIPLVLPGSSGGAPVVAVAGAASSAVSAPVAETPMRAVIQRSLDEGSLFRRGYAAPTP